MGRLTIRDATDIFTAEQSPDFPPLAVRTYSCPRPSADTKISLGRLFPVGFDLLAANDPFGD